MKVLILINSLHFGGGESSAVMMANALAAHSDISVSFAARTGPLRDRLDKAVRFHPLPGRYQPPFVSTMLKVRSLIRRERPDVVHAHGGRLAMTVAAANSLSGHAAPLVITHHSRGFHYLPDSMAGKLLRLSSSRLVAVSHEMREELVTVTASPERVAVIPHALDVETIIKTVESADRLAVRRSFGIDETAHVVSIGSRLVAGKGLNMFIETIEAVAGRLDTPVVGVIAGDGPLAGQLKAQAAGLRHGKVLFIGYQANILPVLAVSDIVLFPSEEEMLPVFLIESSAGGVPVVCSDLPGTREVIADEVSGIVVKKGGDYAAAVARLLENQSERTAMGAAGRQIARERFSAGKVSRQLIDLYEEALASKGR